MQMITITGKQALHGRIRPAAAKNSTLPLLAATLLCRGPCRLQEVPALADVTTSLALLQAVGADVRRCGVDLCTRPVQTLCGEIPESLAGAMRSSVFYLAPLLCRTGYVRLPLPGGCRLGPRPVDIHLAGLAAMGAEVELEGIAVTLRRTGPLHGVDFTLRLPSVGATMTLLMAACCAAGQTVLRGAAQEPEIGDMIAFLSACGADIQGAGTPVLTVQGGRPLGGAFHRPRPTPPHWRARADRSKLRAATRPAMTRFCAFWPGPACRSAGPETACGWPVTPPCRCGAGHTCGPTPGPPLPPTLRRWPPPCC